MKKAGIIGGSGYIGSYITKIFLEENFRVKTSVTDLSKNEKYLHLKNLPNASNLEISGLNVLDANSIKEFVTGCNILVHGGTPFQLEAENPQKELFEPIVNGTENFLNAIKNISTVEKVVILSCVNAYNTSFPLPADDKSTDHLYTEKDVPYMHESNHPYSQARFYADQTVREFIEANPQLSFEIVSLFPTFVVGNSLSDREDSTSVRIQNILKNNLPSDIFLSMLYEKGTQLAMVGVNDVAKAVFKAATKEGDHGKNYFLSSESWKISDISRMLNNRKPIGRPSIAYSNKLASRILGVNFEPVNASLNKFEWPNLTPYNSNRQTTTIMKKLLIAFAVSFITTGLIFQQAQAQMQSSDGDHSDHTVTILAEDYAFQAPDQIPSGWTTIQYENHGNEPHFLLVSEVPEGINLDDYSELVMLFNDVWYSLRDDGIDHETAYEELGANLPEWFAGLEFVGGSGIIHAGTNTEITLNLTPGTHMLECYFKNEDGELHSVEGMLRELTVTDGQSDMSAPEADINITLSNFEMDIEGDLSPGNHTVAVHLVENPEQGFGHNVHVVRVDDDTKVEEVLRRFNFMEVDGMRTPSPYTFAGGMNLMPAGETAYFTTELEPGRYLFVSEYTGHLGVVQDVIIE